MICNLAHMARDSGSEPEPVSAAGRTGTGPGGDLAAVVAATGGDPADRPEGGRGEAIPGATPPEPSRANASSRSPTGSIPALRRTGSLPALATPTPGPSGLHAAAVTPGPTTHGFVTLGRYQLLSRLAVGGMAEVYLARQGEISGFKTLVVVKKVLPHLSVKPDFIDMFLDEARIASMLDHPNVVHITEVGREGDEFFIAMELVQGKPLAALLQHGEKNKTPLPHGLAALIVAHAAAGLHYAHELTDASGNLLGLVHRDVSPQNVMISFEGSVKVIDFGIARALGRLGDTNSGSLKGKLGYMAPEQARGEAVDRRADIFSLGVVLWECVAARRLFLRENELATLRAVAYEPITPPSLFSDVDGTLEAIVMCALERDPEQRFQSAEEMRIALEKWIFAAGGTSTHDLSLLMKAWFPSEHVQWQRAARLALDMQESDTPIDVAFPNLATRSALSRTGTSRPDSSTSRPRPDFTGSMAGYVPISPLPQDAGQPAPSARRRALLPIALVIAAAAGVGGLLVYRGLSQGDRQTTALPADTQAKTAAGPVRPTVELLPPASGAPPAPATASHGASTPGTHETAGTAQDSAAKKKHGVPSGRHGAAKEHEQHATAAAERGAPSDSKASVKRGREFRPNPF